MDRPRTQGRHRAPVDPLAPLKPRTYAVIAGTFLAGLLLSGSLAVIATTPAQARLNLPPAPVPARPAALVPASPRLAETPTAAPPPAPSTWTVVPLRNEGMIALVTRICGQERVGTWRANAAANGIISPLYAVRLDATLEIDCEAAVLPPDPAETAPSPSPTPSAQAAAVPIASGGWFNPLPGACIGSGYGMRGGRMHNGVDLGAGYGTPIRAAAAGTVSVDSQPSGAGNYTVIDHGGGLHTVYMHQSSYQVTSGWVNAGDVIGYVGSTGNSQGPHLHFEVHAALWSNYLDPAAWMADRGVGWGWC